MESLHGQLLISSPILHDPNFRRTVVLVVAHDDDGSVGLVLNRVSEVEVAEAVPELAGLVEHYGFEGDDLAAEYFRLHAERDLEHARASREALAEAPPARQAELAAVAERALEANWRLLDGVEREGQR